MFGWEFPPHILGGLGTASFGLTRGMSMQPDMDITFVIPKPWGDEDQSFLRIIGANTVPVVWRDVDWDFVNNRIGSFLHPDTYYHFRNGIKYNFERISLSHIRIFSGNLFGGNITSYNADRKSIIQHKTYYVSFGIGNS